MSKKPHNYQESLGIGHKAEAKVCSALRLLCIDYELHERYSIMDCLGIDITAFYKGIAHHIQVKAGRKPELAKGFEGREIIYIHSVHYRSVKSIQKELIRKLNIESPSL